MNGLAKLREVTAEDWDRGAVTRALEDAILEGHGRIAMDYLQGHLAEEHQWCGSVLDYAQALQTSLDAFRASWGHQFSILTGGETCVARCHQCGSKFFTEPRRFNDLEMHLSLHMNNGGAAIAGWPGLCTRSYPNKPVHAAAIFRDGGR
jgi:hypothetical protein